MKTDESVTFDYLNPDFTILKDRKLVFVSIPPEYQFYLKHKIIHWFNKINEVYDESHNFESLNLNRYMVGTGNVVSTYSIGNRAGNLYFNYDKQNEFISMSISANYVLYKNNEKFPNTNHLFRLNFTTELDDVLNYNLARSIDLSDTSEDDFIISYDFDINGTKNREYLSFYNIHSTSKEDLVIDDSLTANSSDLFDDFFNQHITTILQSLTTFLELYPQFGIKLINDSNDFKIFYNGLKKLYRAGDFDRGFEENLNVIRMVSI